MKICKSLVNRYKEVKEGKQNLSNIFCRKQLVIKDSRGLDSHRKVKIASFCARFLTQFVSVIWGTIEVFGKFFNWKLGQVDKDLIKYMKWYTLRLNHISFHSIKVGTALGCMIPIWQEHQDIVTTLFICIPSSCWL